MCKNIGITDQIFRLAVGALFLTLPTIAGVNSAPLAIGSTVLVAVLVAVLVSPALIKLCPLYGQLGFNSCRVWV